jgi:sirohydrochlorin ferrochelatase
VNELLGCVRSGAAARGLAGLDVRAAFLDHAAPSPRQVLSAVAESGESSVVVPLLLTAAYHSTTDIPAHIVAAGAALPRLDVRCAGPLGPHPLLLAGLERRLAEAGVAVGDRDARARTNVVLAAAGSSDPAANAAIAAVAAGWQARGGWRRVLPAYASAADPRPDEAVRALRAADPDSPVAVATYLLAPGYFAGKIRATALAAGATAVSAALGAAPEVAGVILDRYAAAVRPGERQALVARLAGVPRVATAPFGRKNFFHQNRYTGGDRPVRAPLSRLWRGHSYPERTVVAAQLSDCSTGQTNTGACPCADALAAATN